MAVGARERVEGDAAARSVHIGRQPIYDADGVLYGYELLFRPTATSSASTRDGDSATTATMLAAFSEFGLPELLSGRFGFVNLTRAYLVGELPLPFEPGVAVLEILETVTLDDEVVAGVRRLRDAGYQLALDDFLWHDAAEPLMDLVSIVKIDVLHPSWDEVVATVERCRRPGIRLLAECVEDADMLQRCRDLGFELFQGYFLGRPQTLSMESLAPSQMQALQLLARLTDPEIELREIEAVLRSDPALSFRLLRLANSSSTGAVRTVASIADAVMLVGLQRLRGWIFLMALSDDDSAAEHVTLALARAHTCELVAREGTEVRPDVAFTLGLLDGIAELLGVTPEQLLDGLPAMSADLDGALRGRPSALRRVLDVVRAYEHRDEAALAAAALPAQRIATCYLAALAWTTTTTGAVSPA